MKKLLFGKVTRDLDEQDLVAYVSSLKKKELYGVTQEYLFKDFEEYKKSKGKQLIVVDLGTHNRRIYKKSINVDLFQKGDTDLVWDITKRLPIKSSSVDFIACSAVLEHVNDPVAVVEEMYRIVKIGGRIWVDIPFMQPYHESPDDYQRYTYSGIKHLFRRFYIVKCGPIPGSGFVLHWLLQEFSKILISEKISLNKYPVLNSLLDDENLTSLDIEVNKLDKSLVKKYPNGIPDVFHRTASGMYVYAEKR